MSKLSLKLFVMDFREPSLGECDGEEEMEETGSIREHVSEQGVRREKLETSHSGESCLKPKMSV